VVNVGRGEGFDVTLIFFDDGPASTAGEARLTVSLVGVKVFARRGEGREGSSPMVRGRSSMSSTSSSSRSRSWAAFFASPSLELLDGCVETSSVCLVAAADSVEGSTGMLSGREGHKESVKAATRGRKRRERSRTNLLGHRSEEVLFLLSPGSTAACRCAFSSSS